jgi:hypothetical protein
LESVLFVNPPTGVGGSKFSSLVLLCESFFRQQQPKLNVFMSPYVSWGFTVNGRHAETSQYFRLLLDTAEWNSVLFVNPPTSVGGSKLSFPVLMRESFLYQQQPKPIVFMSPQRELGGAQSLAGNQKRFVIYGYCWIPVWQILFGLLTHQLALVARN